MEAVGINWGLLAAQLLNLALLALWVALAGVALLRLRRLDLDDRARLGWAALILLVPLLGAIALLIAGRGRTA